MIISLGLFVYTYPKFYERNSARKIESTYINATASTSLIHHRAWLLKSDAEYLEFLREQALYAIRELFLQHNKCRKFDSEEADRTIRLACRVFSVLSIRSKNEYLEAAIAIFKNRDLDPNEIRWLTDQSSDEFVAFDAFLDSVQRKYPKYKLNDSFLRDVSNGEIVKE